ncbi:glycosyl transferase, group 2 family protein [alpha proteobacterium U9-1i]|nr:glycosyl transferase, group 2 family protein [alpha proteobacterium U9-1i]
MGLDGQAPRFDDLRPASVNVEPDVLARAALGFHRAYPARSAKRVLHVTQILVLGVIGYGLWSAFAADATATLRVLYALAFGLFAAAILWRLFAAAQLTPLLSRLAEPVHWPTYTILCPLYREAAVVGDLVAALERIDYPKHALDIKLLIEADDVDTLTMALAIVRSPAIEIVTIPASLPRTKPKALNVGLERARGEYLVVYDAEDNSHPQQLRAALAAFEDDANLACVQAPLVIDNAAETWISRQFAAEYAIQFRQMLPLLAHFQLPLPLGGTSNHFRTNTLRAVGGWDAHNVTEDADLGYRLARARLRAGVIAPPTFEEAPVTFNAWRAQRTRWIKGHLQTWLVLMRNPFRTAQEMGVWSFLAMQLVLGCGLAAAFAHGPLAFIVLIAALSPYELLTAADFVLALTGYCVAVFSALSATAATGDFSHTRAAPTMPFYWPLASIAAYAALFALIVRPHHWAKTTHGVSARTRIESPPLAEAATEPAPLVARVS